MSHSLRSASIQESLFQYPFEAVQQINKSHSLHKQKYDVLIPAISKCFFFFFLYKYIWSYMYVISDSLLPHCSNCLNLFSYVISSFVFLVLCILQLPNIKSLPTHKNRKSNMRIVTFNWCVSMASIRGRRRLSRMATYCQRNSNRFRRICTANLWRKLIISSMKR